MPQDDPDATIIVRRPSRPPAAVAVAAPSPGFARRLPRLLGALAVAAAVAGGASWWLLRPPPPRPRPAPPPIAVAPAPAPVPAPPLQSEAAILAERVDVPTAVRFAPNPKILVIDFPDLRSQGLALDRVAAFVEKANQPRDRVLTDPELAVAIKADDATVATYYYGHDYRGADIERFYTTADRQGFSLSPEEQATRALIARSVPKGSEDWAVITIPREGSDKYVDAAGRQSLLRHELSHGEYFTDPAYAAFVQSFWHNTLTEPDRQAFLTFLTRQGYDPGNHDLIINEMQAHLIHTTDPRYYNAQVGGLTHERLTELRQSFLAAMPKGWLHDTDRAALPSLP